MALSGSLSTSKYEGRYYTLEWSATQNVASNKSTISWTLKAVGGSVRWYAERTLKLVIAGTTRYTKTARVERYTGTIATGSFDLTHDSAGNKSFSASIEAAVYVSNVNCTGSKSFTLTQIPRQATLTSAPNFNDEANPTISYSNPAGSAVSALEACIASSDGSTVYVDYRSISKTGASYTFNLTTAERNTLRNLIPNDKSINVRFYVRTKIGDSTFYSSLTKTFSITNANPTLSPTVTDSDSAMVALTGDANKLVKYYSNATFSFGAAAQKGATIKSYKVVNGSKSSTSSSGTLSNVESGTFTFTVTDSRGNTTTKTVTKTLVSYIKLSVNVSGSLSTEGALSATVSGNYFNSSFGSTSNTLTCKCRYRVKGGSYNSWTTVSATKSGNTYSASFDATGLNYRKSYEVQFQVTDKIRDLTKTITVYCEPVFDWGPEDFNVNVNFNMNGETVLRHNEDANNVVLSASGGHIYIRPQGTDNTTGEIRITSQGDIIIGGQSLKSLLGIS